MKAILNLDNTDVLSDSNKAREGSIINPQLYFFKDNNQIICYAPYDRFAALIDQSEYGYLISHKYLTKDAPSDLFYGKFYVEEEKNKGKKDNYEFSVGDKRVYSPDELTVFLGDACNLNCIYCNAVPNRKNLFSARATLKAVKIMLDKFNIKKISFFGNGEPLLYFDTIKEITELAKSRGCDSFYVCTNGVIPRNRDEIIKFLIENNFYIQLSIDGDPYIQNLQRPAKNKNYNSSTEVEKTVNEIKKYGPLDKYAYARMTLTKEVLDRMEEIILYLKNLGFKKIRCAELIYEGKAVENKLKKPNLEEYIDRIVDILLFSEQLGVDFSGDFDPRSPSESGIYPCPYMAGRSVSLNEELKLLSCLEDIPYWVIGNVNIQTSEIFVSMEKVEALRNRNSNTLNCESCPVKCGGGCTHSSFLASGRMDLQGDYEGKCHILQSILYKYLKKRLENGDVNKK